ncbi:MAG: DUF692 family protein, partial [Leptospiraceae bacterium]|nr:DUF692 family protein [Leptospiraceae bacterium]
MQLRFSGVGAGLRPTHYSHLLENSAEAVHADWFEAISENYMDSHGRPLEVLTRIRETYPVALHGVGLSPGSVDGVDAGYLKRLRCLVDRIEPFLVSDHCSFGSTGAEHLHDLLPVPYNAESLRAMCANIDRA